MTATLALAQELIRRASVTPKDAGCQPYLAERLARLGFVVPLGGTTLFFRRDLLEAVGAWDAFNVTEDADLGIRLAQTLDITESRRVGAGVIVGEGGVITQTHPQRELDWFHAGGAVSCETSGDSP